MTITLGNPFPDATLIRSTDDGFESVALADYVKGRKVALFALPGAYTGTCNTVHLPSFVRTADDLRAAGIDEVICVAVNDPFVMKTWGETSGATEAGITMLADPAAELTKAVGMEFTAPQIGLYDRSNRYALVLDDGVVSIAKIDDPGVCEMSVGEELLSAVREKSTE